MPTGALSVLSRGVERAVPAQSMAQFMAGASGSRMLQALRPCLRAWMYLFGPVGSRRHPSLTIRLANLAAMEASVRRVSVRLACALGSAPTMDHARKALTVIHSASSVFQTRSIRTIRLLPAAVMPTKRATKAGAHRRMARLWPCLEFGGRGGVVNLNRLSSSRGHTFQGHSFQPILRRERQRLLE